MVLHPSIVEHVAPDLRAPFDLLLARLDFCGLRPTFLELYLVQLGTQQTQCVFLVLWLVACLGVLDHDLILLVGQHVVELIVQTHTRLDLVHVLSTRTAGAESVPREVRRIDVDLDGVVHQRNDEHGGERGHTLSLRIERGDAHQAVHTVFALQVTVGEVSLHLDGDGLDARLVSFEQVGDLRLVSFRFAPAEVHSHEHIAPVLRFRSSGTRHDLQDSAHLILLLAEHVLQLQFLRQVDGMGIGGIHLLFRHGLLLIEVEREFQLLDGILHIVIAIHPFLDVLDFLHLRLRGFLVVPETRGLCA